MSASVEIRPIRSGDGALLDDAWARTTPQSRRRRMNGTLEHLRPSELRYLTEIDHHDHEAMVAIDPDTGRLVGVMRYIRCPDAPEDAELAALVVDNWQRRGVATALLAELSAHALADGIETYRAIVSPENTPAIAALTRLGARRRYLDGELHFLVPVRNTVAAAV